MHGIMGGCISRRMEKIIYIKMLGFFKIFKVNNNLLCFWLEQLGLLKLGPDLDYV